jgi:hypothetical protein
MRIRLGQHDDKAIARLAFGLRWKVALDVPSDCEPPGLSSLSVFRKRLVKHEQEPPKIGQT